MPMSNRGRTPHRTAQRGAVLLGLAGGMIVVAGGFVGGYFVIGGNRGVASAASTPPTETRPAAAIGAPVPDSLTALLAREVTLKTASGTAKVTWAELGLELDPDEAARVSGADLASLATRGSLPVRIDR